MADKLQGTWVLNDPPSYEDFDEFDENQYSCTIAFVEFISNDTTYTAFSTTHTPNDCTIQYGGTYVYEDYINASSGGWANEAYKTIYVTSTITGSSGTEYTFRQNFLTWLESNATKQIEPITYDLTQLNLDAGTHTITVKGKADGYRDSAVSDGVSYTVAPSTVTIPSGTYVGKDTLTIPIGSTLNYDLSFISNGVTYTNMSIIGWNGEYYTDECYLNYDATQAYYYYWYHDGTPVNEWQNTAYKTITIATDQEVSPEFAEWFNENYPRSNEASFD